ncbi:MAG: hypothetical protein IKU54_05115 [Oscillospiraceae bacterium]|nr:hypothetical protein [Oscillospiraceae bacterium]
MKKLLSVILVFIMLFLVGCAEEQDSKLQLCGMDISQWAQESENGFIFTAGKSYVGRDTEYTGEDRYLWCHSDQGSYSLKTISEFFNGIEWGETVPFDREDIKDELYYYVAGIRGLDEIDTRAGIFVWFYDNFTRAVAVRGDLHSLKANVAGTAFIVNNPDYVKQFFVDKDIYLSENTIICGKEIAPWIVNSQMDNNEFKWPIAVTFVNNKTVAGHKYLNGDWKRIYTDKKDVLKAFTLIETESQPVPYDYTADEYCWYVTLLATPEEYEEVEATQFTFCISADFEYIGLIEDSVNLDGLYYPHGAWKIKNPRQVKEAFEKGGVIMAPMADRSQITGADGPCGVDISFWLEEYGKAPGIVNARMHLATVMNNNVVYENDTRTVGGKGKSVVGGNIKKHLPALENFKTTDSVPYDFSYLTKDDYVYFMDFYLMENTRQARPDAPADITFMFFGDFKYVVVSDKPQSVGSSGERYIVSDIYTVSNPDEIRRCFEQQEIYMG